jgi:ubiquinone/menaquinone biosynthesis C-methylase UbiE
MIDKDIERRRYDNRAKFRLNANKLNHINKIPEYLNIPYKHYFKLLEGLHDQPKLLEIGAGMGENTDLLLDMQFEITSTDISQKSVEVMRGMFSDNADFSAEVADMEKLPFNNESFDVVCSAGSLSYGDNDVVMNEIYRVLKRGGVMIAVDSLNDNPIYRLNRYMHYLKGNRSKSTLIRMPTISLIDKYTEKFGYAEVKFFGAITWTFPLLSKILSEQAVIKLSNWIDIKFNIRESAFKFVIMLEKNET